MQLYKVPHFSVRAAHEDLAVLVLKLRSACIYETLPNEEMLNTEPKHEHQNSLVKNGHCIDLDLIYRIPWSLSAPLVLSE